jgi:hypothetical protein
MPTFAKTFEKTKTAAIRWGRFDFTPAGGAITKISCKLFDPEAKLQTVLLKQPGADDANHAVDEVLLEFDETITLVDIEEIDSVFALLGGLNGLVKGTGKIYLRDPRDAASKVKYALTAAAGAAFDCSVKRPDGAIRMGGTEFSKTSLVITNLSGAKLVATVAGDMPDA